MRRSERASLRDLCPCERWTQRGRFPLASTGQGGAESTTSQASHRQLPPSRVSVVGPCFDGTTYLGRAQLWFCVRRLGGMFWLGRQKSVFTDNSIWFLWNRLLYLRVLRFFHAWETIVYKFDMGSRKKSEKHLHSIEKISSMTNNILSVVFFPDRSKE